MREQTGTLFELMGCMKTGTKLVDNFFQEVSEELRLQVGLQQVVFLLPDRIEGQ